MSEKEEKTVIAEFPCVAAVLSPSTWDQMGYFQASDDGTLVVFADGRQPDLQQIYDAVAEVVNPERQAGH